MNFRSIGLAVIACLMVLGCANNTSELASEARMWRAQLEPQQQAARKAGRSGWIGKAGPGVEMTSTKKGVGYWSNDGIDRMLQVSGASWCYNWGVAPVGTAMKDIEFVPMIWDEKHVNSKDLATVKTSGKVLLTFNEPNAKDQANMTVEQALSLWPQLEATGMRLGSPAPTRGEALAGGWLHRFMQGIKAKGYRVDFVCVHHYSANYEAPQAAAAELRDYLSRVHELYGKPVWLTEFALANWRTAATSKQQRSYLKEAVAMLERLPFVERYAWFAMQRFKGANDAVANSHLTDDNGKLNLTGIAYRDAK
jgi:Glycosyl hydrolase catalytic core